MGEMLGTLIDVRSHIDRYEKRHKNLAAHVSPAFRAEVGDIVTVGALFLMHIIIYRKILMIVHSQSIVGQCRPLSKTVRFNVLRVSKNKAAAKAFGKF